jgi:hypothetical protein
MHFSETFPTSIFRIKYNVPSYDFNVTYLVTNVSVKYVVSILKVEILPYLL